MHCARNFILILHALIVPIMNVQPFGCDIMHAWILRWGQPKRTLLFLDRRCLKGQIGFT